MSKLQHTSPENAKKRTTRWVVLFCVVAALVLGCVLVDTFTDWLTPSKVTAKEFDRIHYGMSEQEMKNILGEGFKSRQMRLNERAQTETTYVYPGVGEGNCEVTLFFVGGKLDWKMHTGIVGELLKENAHFR